MPSDKRYLPGQGAPPRNLPDLDDQDPCLRRLPCARPVACVIRLRVLRCHKVCALATAMAAERTQA